MPDPRRQILAILSDHRSHVWSDITRAVALVHGIPQKGVSSLLREMIASGEIERDNLGGRGHAVRLVAGSSGES